MTLTNCFAKDTSQQNQRLAISLEISPTQAMTLVVTQSFSSPIDHLIILVELVFIPQKKRVKSRHGPQLWGLFPLVSSSNLDQLVLQVPTWFPGHTSATKCRFSGFLFNFFLSKVTGFSGKVVMFPLVLAVVVVVASSIQSMFFSETIFSFSSTLPRRLLQF